MSYDWETHVNRYPIRCNPTGIYGQVFFTGCLLPSCVIPPTKIRMTVLKGEQVVRVEDTPFIRPDLAPFLPGSYFTLRRGESCEDLQFNLIDIYGGTKRFSCKFFLSSVIRNGIM